MNFKKRGKNFEGVTLSYSGYESKAFDSNTSSSMISNQFLIFKLSNQIARTQTDTQTYRRIGHCIHGTC